MIFSRRQAEYLSRAQVARLGTLDSKGLVHIVPIVFANSQNSIYFVIDEKRKRTQNLKRLANISENPYSTLLVDQYSDSWEKLSYFLIYCKAKILWPGQNLSEKKIAARLLRRKYMQYQIGQFFPSEIGKAIFVRLSPRRGIFWQNLRRSVG